MEQKPQLKKVVYFVRHGQSEANVSPIFQAPDAPLSETGKQQIKSIAQRASMLSFEAIISSPFERARQTADEIAQATGKSMEISDLFVERVKPSSIHGKAFTDEQADRTWRAWNASLYAPGVKVEDGENFDDIVTRADQALSYLHERKEASMLVVTHGFFMKAIIARVLLGDLLSGATFKRIRKKMASMENTGLTVLQYRGGFEEESTWRLWIYNDHTHLGE